MSLKLDAYESGMVRENKEYKTDFTLALDGPMFERYARHMTNGAIVHGKRNWMKANGEAELADFKAGAFRHMVQWLMGEIGEDHAAAIIFNLNGAELCKAKMSTNEASASQNRSSALSSTQQSKARELTRDLDGWPVKR